MSNDEKLSRRAALLGIGALGGGAALAACKKEWSPPDQDPYSVARAKPYVPGAEAWSTGEERFATSSCAQCPAACGIRVRVVEGRAVRIEGNENNPVNRGGIGPRGLAGLQVLYDPDRITGPMIRRDGKLVPASWEEAQARVVAELKAVRAGGHADQLLIMSGRERGMMHQLFERFARAFGTPNFVDGRGNRSGVLAQSMEEAFGSYESPAFDWAGANYVLALEAGLLEDSCQAVYFARVAAERRRGPDARRSRIVSAGAAFDLSAFNADEWIRIQPGTSGALALALCRELLVNESYDQVAVSAQVSGLDEFRAAIAQYTPDYVAALTGMPAQTIPRVAQELWNNRPSFAFIDERSVAFSNGRETALAVFALNSLLGAVEAPEGGMRLAPIAPTGDWPAPIIDELAAAGLAAPRMDRAGTSEFPRARSVQEKLVDAIDRKAPQVALLYYANPIYARHQPARWRAAMAKIPFLVSFSPFYDETVSELAHVVLPDHSYLERFEDATPAPALDRAVMGIHKPVVAPLHDTRSTGDVLIELAHALEGSVAASMPWRELREAIDQRLVALQGAAAGSIRAATAQAFLDDLYQVGVWNDVTPAEPRAIHHRLDASWAPAQWAGEESSFPLKLVLYRALGHAVGSGANQPWLHQLRARPGAKVWEHVALVHPSSAAHLSEHDEIRIASQWGQLVMPIRFERRMSPGFVAVSLGRGHTAFGRFAKGIGVNALELVAPGAAPVTGASVLCGTRVRLEKAHG